MNIRFYSLSSGSSGNCYYLGNEDHGILVDAGISSLSIRRFMGKIGLDPGKLMGVLVTHNHTDHTRGLEVLTRRNHLPVYTTVNVWKSIARPPGRLQGSALREISLGEKFQLAGFVIEAFEVSHDAPETIGFHISGGGEKITIVTDLGHISENSAKYIRDANILVIESNYDENMLSEGSYPPFLKRRIESHRGHLGNLQASSFIAENFNSALKVIGLAHLSKNNNTPGLALQALHTAMEERGVKINGRQHIKVLSRNTPTEIFRSDT